MLCLSGCVNLKKASIETIIKETTASKVKVSNQIRTGYKYYLPSNLNSVKSLKMNEIISSDDLKYYLFVYILLLH